MKKTLTLTTITIAIFLSLSSSAVASTYTWNLAPGPTSQLLGTSETLTSTTGGLTLGFTGNVIDSNGKVTLSDLYAKVGGGDETGLGLAADPTGQNEIFKNSFVQIDLTSLLAANKVNSLSLIIGSVQSGEGFAVWGSNTAGQEGSVLMTGGSSMNGVAFNVPSFGNYNYVSISATANNVLLDTVTAAGSTTVTSTPEPSTMVLDLLAGLGLMATALVRRRKKTEA